MLRALPLLLFTLFFLKGLESAAQTSTPRYIKMTSKVGGYYEYLPQGYNPNNTAGYPLIVYLHGNSERGSGDSVGLLRIIGGGLPKVMSAPDFPTSFTVNNQVYHFIVISPQFGPRPDALDVDSVLSYVLAHYPIDVSRIYLTGFSMGGGACWDFAGANKTFANKIAALVPVSGSGEPDTVKTRIIAGSNLPVWATHNNGDLTVPVATTITYIDFINRAPASNPLAKKTIFTSTSHNAWAATYKPTFKENNLNVFEWMLGFKRTPAAQQIAPKAVNVNLYGGSNGYTNTQWNNWNVSTNLTAGPFRFSNGTTSGIGATLSKSSSINDNGTTYGSGMAAAEVLRYASNAAVERTLTLNGLSTEKTYSLELYASRNNYSGNVTVFTVNGVAQSISTYKNLAQKAVFNSLHSSAEGKLTVSIKNANSYNYINGFSLFEEDGTSNTAPISKAGGDQTITLPASSVNLAGSGVDGDGSIATYTWSKVSGNEVTFSSRNTAATAVTGLAEGTYVFRLLVKDNDGATSFDDVTVTVKPAPLLAGSKQIKVNLYGGSNSYSNLEWNNWNVSGSLNSGLLKYSDATASGVNAVLSRNTVADNGLLYGGIMAPPEVLRYASYSSSKRTLTFNGLAPAKTYSLELYASRNNSGNATQFLVANTSTTIVTDKNKTNKAVFNNLSADAFGKLVITITNVNAYNYLNGFILTEDALANTTVQTAPEEEAKTTIHKTAGGLNVRAFPNPSSESFTVFVTANSSAPARLRIFDELGRLVEVIEMVLPKNSASFGKGFKKGRYYVEVVQGAEKTFIKLQKTADG